MERDQSETQDIYTTVERRHWRAIDDAKREGQNLTASEHATQPLHPPRQPGGGLGQGKGRSARMTQESKERGVISETKARWEEEAGGLMEARRMWE